MKSIKLDFIRTHSLLKRFTRTLLLILGVSGLAFTISKYQHTNIKSDALNLKIIYLEKNRQLNTSKTYSKADQQLNDQILEAQKILHDLNRPWDQLFVALEKSVSKDIIIMSVSPNSTKSGIEIIGLSPEVNHLLDFMSRLQNSSFFKQIYLDEQEVYDENPKMHLKFKVTANWEQNQ